MWNKFKKAFRKRLKESEEKGTIRVEGREIDIDPFPNISDTLERRGWRGVSRELRSDPRWLLGTRKTKRKKK